MNYNLLVNGVTVARHLTKNVAQRTAFKRKGAAAWDT